MTLPEIGSNWVHKRGNEYEVLAIANVHAKDERREDYPLLVIYQGLDGKIWSRGVISWNKTMSPKSS